VWLFAATIFLSAFLLFQIQPLIGKWILPWFGGGPAVWTTCLLFFQTTLLGGYAYAHVLRTLLKERGQMVVHLVLLTGAVVALNWLAPSESWKPQGGEDPTWRVLALLAVAVGLPYFVLSATSPLIQAWFSVTYAGRSPYRLYALSNVGSLLALASYPFVVEPLLRLQVQGWVWSGGFLVFAALCGLCAVRAFRASGRVAVTLAPVGTSPQAARSPRVAHLLWLALPACGSVMLMATTNQMCSDVPAVPFLWIVPLGLYLLSFILVFDSDRVYYRPVFWPAMALAAAGVLYLLHENVDLSILWQIAGYSAAMFICCMVCHGELARLKPAPRYLTTFFLLSSAGGAVGGLFVALVAPILFKGYFEFHVGLAGCFVLALLAYYFQQPQSLRLSGKQWAGQAVLGLVGLAALGTLGFYLARDAKNQIAGATELARNFYGVLQVTENDADNPRWHSFTLRHGRILHGTQYTSSRLRFKPVTYYGPESGVGRAVLYRRGPTESLRVGIVGLGTGTMAAWGSTGDTYRFYEINPAVLHLAQTRFTFLKDSKADVEVVMGDARLSMEREPSQRYDILVLDAFSSDSIPMHLLTKEAVQLYRRHLVKDGVLAIHISNRFLDLRPVCLALAEHFGMGAAIIADYPNQRVFVPETPDDLDPYAGAEYSASVWVLVTEDADFLANPCVQGGLEDPAEMPTKRRLWTDDYSDIFSLLRTGG
jgi:hypothetical protein